VGGERWREKGGVSLNFENEEERWGGRCGLSV